MYTDNTIFDDVFKTLLEKMPHLVIPLINEAFHTTYDENTAIVQLRNEHQTKSGERETDSCLLIEEKMYHIECQSNTDSTMIIRMIEYDFTIALEHITKEEDRYTLEFPKSCVLYLRHNSNTKDELKAQVRLPDGETFTYCVPVIKVQNYTKDVLFQKKLLFLLPFYVMRYEKMAKQIEENEEELMELLKEYEDIRKRLNESLGEGEHGNEYSNLLGLITRISDYIFADEDTVKKGLSDTMRGKVLELESERYERELKEAIARELPKAVARELPEAIARELPKVAGAAVKEKEIRSRITSLYEYAGFTPEKIAEKTGDSLEIVKQILKEEGLFPTEECVTK